LSGCKGIGEPEPSYGFSLAGIIAVGRETSPVTIRGAAVLVVLVGIETKARGNGALVFSTGWATG